MRHHHIRGFTNKPFETIVAIGIGGSYLGPEFVYEALKGAEDVQKNNVGL